VSRITTTPSVVSVIVSPASGIESEFDAMWRNMN